MRRRGPLAVLIALGVVAIGALHLWLYVDGYQDVPDIGRGFLVNAVASFAAAAIALVWDHVLAVVPALVIANVTLLGFALSRTDGGVPLTDPAFIERGWNPSPEAALAVGVEIATAALCVAALAFRRRSVG